MLLLRNNLNGKIFLSKLKQAYSNHFRKFFQENGGNDSLSLRLSHKRLTCLCEFGKMFDCWQFYMAQHIVPTVRVKKNLFSKISNFRF